jgi:hypothetical protein
VSVVFFTRHDSFREKLKIRTRVFVKISQDFLKMIICVGFYKTIYELFTIICAGLGNHEGDLDCLEKFFMVSIIYQKS